MFTKQYGKKKRCNECRRRKKKCEMSGDSCLYCLQKGIKCSFPDEILDFDPQNGKINKKESQNQTMVKLNNIDKSKKLFIQPKFPSQLFFPNQNKFFLIGYLNPKLYIPVSDSVIKSNNLTMQKGKTISIHVYNKDMAIDDKFALSKYALSSVRIKYLDDNNNFESDRMIIERFADLNINDGPFEFFRKNNITILENKNEPNNDKLLMKTNVKSMDEINLKIDFENLKNILMIEEPSITTDSNDRKFINLPYFINAKMANSLFNYFCDACTKEVPVSSHSSNVKISMLTVALPLILGNLTILRAVLLCSYFHKLQHKGKDKNLLKILPQMKRLHLDVLTDLSKRLKYYSSVSCDHSIFCVFILLTIEIINGGKGKLWHKLQNLAQSMISLRGGVKELCQTLTGECMLKLLMSIICTEVDPTSIAFGIEDLKYLFEFNEKHEFFDNLVNMGSLVMKDFRVVIQMYFRVSKFRSSVNPSLGTGKEDDGNKHKTDNFDYLGTDESNLEKVMYEAFVLEMDIKCFDHTDMFKMSLINEQIKFAVDSCLLYIYQLIYKQTPL